jgi:hypothetical protein
MNSSNNVNATDTHSVVESRISSTYPHLFVETADYINRPLEEQIRMVHADKFILHEKAQKALMAMKEIYSRPKDVVRPPCLAVIANSNEGKTAVAKRFYKDLGGEAASAFGFHDEIPIVMVEMPARSTEPRVCLAIARALGLTAYGSAAKSRMISDNVMRALVSKKVTVLILIEFQHVAPIPKTERQVVYDLVKGISNHGISVIAIGTQDAKVCLAEDEQVANRMRVVTLTSFALDQRFYDFLHSLEHYYPFPKASGLATVAMAKEIHLRTNGVTGEVVALCNAAAAYALRKKLPCIDMGVLKNSALFPAANAA